MQGRQRERSAHPQVQGKNRRRTEGRQKWKSQLEMNKLRSLHTACAEPAVESNTHVTLTLAPGGLVRGSMSIDHRPGVSQVENQNQKKKKRRRVFLSPCDTWWALGDFSERPVSSPGYLSSSSPPTPRLYSVMRLPLGEIEATRCPVLHFIETEQLLWALNCSISQPNACSNGDPGTQGPVGYHSWAEGWGTETLGPGGRSFWAKGGGLGAYISADAPGCRSDPNLRQFHVMAWASSPAAQSKRESPGKVTKQVGRQP